MPWVSFVDIKTEFFLKFCLSYEPNDIIMGAWKMTGSDTHEDHRSGTRKFVTPPAPSCIDNSWRSTTLPGADSASSNQTLPFQNEHEWVLEKLR